MRVSLVLILFSLAVASVLPQTCLAAADQQLMSRIAQTPDLGPYNIELTYRHGAVHLTGTVGSFEDKARIERIIMGDQRVEWVNNDLRVTEEYKRARYQAVPAASSVSDSDLNILVSEALTEVNSDFNGITVAAQSGDVTLSGNQPSFRDVDQILSVVLNVNGVNSVDSRITVNGHSYPTSAFSQ